MRTINRKVAAMGAAAGILATAAGASIVTAPAQAAPTTVVSAAPKVSMQVSTTRAAKGERIVVNGVGPARASIVIQVAAGRTWRTVGKTTSARNGAYRVTVQHVGGVASYRAVGAYGRKSVVSAVRKVNAPAVMKTFDLARYKEADGGFSRAFALTVGGETFSSALKSFNGDAASWNINGACTRLTAYIAQEDPDDHSRVQVKADRQKMAELDVPATGARELSVDLRGVKVLTVGAINETSTYNAVVIADPQITCSVAPGVPRQ